MISENHSNKSILLTTVCRPFGEPGDGDSVSAELFHAQVTRSQGIFSFRQVIRCWGLDYIAENIKAPCAVLHYPSKRELKRELKIRDYDYIGINFVCSTFHKLKAMIPLIKKYAPNAKIILGGYGTVLSDKELEPYGDFICREEGIGYMRKLLGEDTEQPIHHPYAPVPSPRFYHYQQDSKVAHITGGLGCPNGCDFCCTSHFFKRKYLPFVKSGRDLYETMGQMKKEAAEKGDTISGFIFIDEDFFLHQKRAREFLECVREGGVHTPVMGFGSVKGLSNFTADEIAEMGFETIWTAFEGTEAGYNKLKGKSLEELYGSLKARGINILSSMIIGFPYQTREKIRAEFDQLMELNPSMAQFLIYFAFPGTPFYNQVVEEGRYLPEYKEDPDYRKWDGFFMHFKHPEFSAKELEQLQRDLFKDDFHTLGSSLIRSVRVWREGSRNLKNSENPLLKSRAQSMKEYVRGAIPGIIPAMFFSPTKQNRKEAKQLLTDIISDSGSLTMSERGFCAGAILLAGWTWLSAKLNIHQQAALLRTEYRFDKKRSWAEGVNRLQGGFYADPLYALWEDLGYHAKQIAVKLRRSFLRKASVHGQ
jgi:radical SAM superfamily enzyme YgiQ (UPF0313 family)